MHVTLELGSTSVEVAEYSGTDLLAVRALVAHGELVLMREAVCAEHVDNRPQDIAESVSECAAVPLSCLTGVGGPRWPLLVGRREAIRFLCSYAERVPPEPFPCEANPVITNYREFKDLWTLAATVTSPSRVGIQIGQRMGEMHSMNVLHGDAHWGNWLFDDSGTALIYDARPVFLHCRPTPEQCATDIRPLLRGLHPAHWLGFRLGYRAAWPEQERVIDLIQLGDLTGWAGAFRSREHSRAVELIDDQLSGDCDPVVRVMLLANRAISSVRLGNLDEGKGNHRAAVELAKRRCPRVVEGMGMVHALILLAEGRRVEAVDRLSSILDNAERWAVWFEQPDAQIPIVNL